MDSETPAKASVNDERFRLMVESVTEHAFALLESDGTISSWNSGAQAILGYSSQEAVGKHFALIYSSTEVASGKPQAVLKTALDSGEYEEHGWRHRKDGSRFMARVTVRPMKGADGRLLGFTKVVRDVSSESKASDRFRRAVEAAPTAMIMVDAQGRVVLANTQALRMFGYSEAELLNRPVEILIPERFRRDHPGLRADFFAQPQARPMGVGRDLFGRRKNGTEFPVEIGLNPLETDEGMMVLSSIIDITERKRAEERFRLAVEASPNAMIMVDARGRIVFSNAQAHRMFGYSADELNGHSIELLIPERFRPNHPAQRDSFFAAPQVRPMGKGRELFGRKKSGEEFPVEIGLNPIETSDGLHVLSSIIDITERRRAEDERRKLLEREQQARAEAENANRMKDEFLAVCSHELRTPLTPILGWTRLLRTSPFDKKSIEHALEVIERNARIEKQLIEDLLDISRVLSGKMKLELVRTDLIPVVRDSIEAVRPAAQAKGICIEISLNSMISDVLSDANRIQQIVWNLLTNAIKFSPRNALIRVRLEQFGNDVQIVVSDEGEGISQEFLPYIFDRFRQADSSTTRVHGGLGLGLSIVKNLVGLHGGTIRVESAGKGKGSTFVVTLPGLSRAVDSFAINAPQIPPTHEHENVLRGLRVLVVDDEPDTCEFVSIALQNYGAIVSTAGSAREALDILKKTPPDILISDIGMPVEDGYELLKKVRELNEKASNIPAIALTAYAKLEDRRRALAAGFQEHVAKPIEPSELERIIAELLRKPRSEDAVV